MAFQSYFVCQNFSRKLQHSVIWYFKVARVWLEKKCRQIWKHVVISMGAIDILYDENSIYSKEHNVLFKECNLNLLGAYL